MKRYVDTSVLTGIYCQEPDSKRAQKALENCEPVISRLTRLEFSSAVAKKLRTGTFTEAEAVRIVSRFHDHIRAGVFIMVAVEESHYALANEWVDSFTTALRALDALQLAVAHGHGLPLVTADKALVNAARQLDVNVQTL